MKLQKVFDWYSIFTSIFIVFSSTKSNASSEQLSGWSVPWYLIFVSVEQFANYSTFRTFAFNSDYSTNSAETVSTSVWFIPNNNTSNEYKDYFKHNEYLLGFPQLASANLATTSLKKANFISRINEDATDVDVFDILQEMNITIMIGGYNVKRSNFKIEDFYNTLKGDVIYTLSDEQNPGILKKITRSFVIYSLPIGKDV